MSEEGRDWLTRVREFHNVLDVVDYPCEPGSSLWIVLIRWDGYKPGWLSYVYDEDCDSTFAWKNRQRWNSQTMVATSDEALAWAAEWLAGRQLVRP